MYGYNDAFFSLSKFKTVYRSDKHEDFILLKNKLKLGRDVGCLLNYCTIEKRKPNEKKM